MLDLDPGLRIALYASLWAFCVLLEFRLILKGRNSLGLPIAFLILLTSAHVGALVHLDDNYYFQSNLYLRSWQYTRETVAIGLESSLIGVIAFVVGTIVANRYDRRRNSGIVVCASPQPPTNPQLLTETAKIFLLAALCAYGWRALVRLTDTSVAGLDSLIQTTANGLLVGSIGYAVFYFRLGNKLRATSIILITAVVLPMSAMLMSGILADTVATGIIMVCFFSVLTKPSSLGYVRGTIILSVSMYAFIMLGSLWLEIRPQVRAAVSSNTSLTQRVSVVLSALSEAELFSGGQTQLEYIDMRMNQNIVVGRAIELLEQGAVSFESGGQISMAFLGWVPRAIWENKPTRGGTEAVAKYTGKQFAEGVTFGTGPIFESYLDFGNYSVFAVMVAYGFVLRRLDRRSAAILNGDYSPGWCRALLCAIPMVTALNSLFFTVNSIVAGALVGWALLFFVKKPTIGLRRKPQVGFALPRS